MENVLANDRMRRYLTFMRCGLMRRLLQNEYATHLAAGVDADDEGLVDLADTEATLADIQAGVMDDDLTDDGMHIVEELVRDQADVAGSRDRVAMSERAAIAHDRFLRLICDAERDIVAHSCDPSTANKTQRDASLAAVTAFHAHALNDDLPLASSVGPEAATRAAARCDAMRSS